MQKQKIQKTGILLLKVSAFVAAWGYVYYKFKHMSNDVFLLITDSRFTLQLIFLLFLLMVFNWLFEIVKWQYLVQKIQKISFYNAFKGVLVGLPLALITPNRIGEIGGRAIVVKQNKKKVMFATFIGSFFQLASTLLFGILGFITYYLFLPKNMMISVASYISILSVLFMFILIVFSKKIRLMKFVFLRIVGKNNYKKTVRIFALYSMKNIGSVLIFSLMRYIIFGSQFCLLLHVFIPELSIVELIVGVTLTYFFVTVIPTSVLGEIGIRGSVAMFIFGIFTTQELIVFQVSLLIWLVNIVIPTLVGSFYLLGIKKGEIFSKI